MEKDQLTNNQKPATRTHTKIAVLFKASYERDFSQGSLHNISLTGAFLFNSGVDIHKDQKYVNLYIKLNQRNRKILAKVVWKSEQGYGLQFVRTTLQDKKLIDDLIYFEEQKNKTKQNILRNIFKKVA